MHFTSFGARTSLRRLRVVVETCWLAQALSLCGIAAHESRPTAQLHPGKGFRAKPRGPKTSENLSEESNLPRRYPEKIGRKTLKSSVKAISSVF